MGSETAARAVLVALLLLTSYLMFRIFSPFLPGIAWAVVLTVAFQPVYETLVRWFRGRSWVAAILLSALVAAFIVVPAVLAVIEVGQGLVEAYAWLERQTARGGEAVRLREIPQVADLIGWLEATFDVDESELRATALSTLKTVGTALAGRSRALLANAFGTALTLIVMLVTMAFLFHEGPRLLETVRRYLPLREKDREAVFESLRDVTRSVFFGVLLTALVQAVLATIGFAFVGLPSAVALGAAVFFSALLPLGPAVVWLPAVGWLFFSGEPVRATVLLVWGVAAVSSVDNLLRPIFIGRGARMHMLLVFFGIFGGIMAFGLIGIFTGPLVITLFLFLVEVARKDFFRDAELAPPRSTES